MNQYYVNVVLIHHCFKKNERWLVWWVQIALDMIVHVLCYCMAFIIPNKEYYLLKTSIPFFFFIENCQPLYSLCSNLIVLYHILQTATKRIGWRLFIYLSLSFFFFFSSSEMRTYEDAILDEAELLVKNINKVQIKTITLDKRLTRSIVKSMCVSNERCWINKYDWKITKDREKDFFSLYLFPYLSL